MASDPQSSPFGEIAAAVVRRLVAVTGLDPAYVRLVASDDYDGLPDAEPRFLYVRCYGPTPDTDHGGGRRSRPRFRLIRVYIYTRNSLDQYGDDTTALTADEAHFEFEETVYDALDDFYPRDGNSGLPITIEPLHPTDSANGPPVRKAENDVGLIRSHADFQARYVGPNSNPQP